MQFLDAIGLASFWNKIKNWVNASFFSKRGGEITPEQGLNYTINGEHLSVTKSGNGNETIDIFEVDKNGMKAISIVKTGGTATQVLMADGSVRTLNADNGIAGLDSNGNIPLDQLGNLDTTVAEVVTALPTSNIKRHIYLVKDSDTANNKYAEYVYTGDISAAYDSTKWEKLGDFRATVDLADYAKKSETVDFSEIRLDLHPLDEAPQINQQVIQFVNFNGDIKEVVVNDATSNMAGFMSVRDKNKLDWFDISNINIRSLDVGKLLTVSGVIPIMITYDTDFLQVSFNTVAGNPISFTLPAAGERAGLMTAADKTKLNGIAANANNYSLPLAANGTRGGIQVGYEANGRNYPVQLSGEKAYVNVPWTDTNTTYDLSPYAKTADVNTALAKKVDVVSGKGLSTEDFTAALKTKLNGIATGATADSAIPISVIDALN